MGAGYRFIAVSGLGLHLLLYAAPFFVNLISAVPYQGYKVM